MKGEHADYVIPLERAFSFPPKKRIRKAVAVIKQFVKKHTHYNDTSLSNEVNEFLHLHSKNIPHRINATILIDGAKAHVFLQKGTGLEEHKKKKEAKKKKKEAKKEEKEKADEQEEKEAAEEKKKKLEDKREKEEAAKADIKRKTA